MNRIASDNITDLLGALRAATRARHEQLHEHAALKSLSDGTVTLERYRAAIAGFYGFYKPLEDQYADFPEARFSDFPHHFAARNLEKDLRRQDIDPATVPSIKTDESAFSSEQVIGYLYLREGSTLGGQMISKHLARDLALLPGIDNHFFYGYGPETGPSWKRFVALLGEIGDSIDVSEAAAFSATLFQTLDDWLLHAY